MTDWAVCDFRLEELPWSWYTLLRVFKGKNQTFATLYRFIDLNNEIFGIITFAVSDKSKKSKGLQ